MNDLEHGARDGNNEESGTCIQSCPLLNMKTESPINFNFNFQYSRGRINIYFTKNINPFYLQNEFTFVACCTVLVSCHGCV